MNKIKLPELLLPAGNFEKLITALRYGADAVYFAGESLGLRAAKTGFSREAMSEALKLVHKAGKKAYITLNIMAHNEDLKEIGDYLSFLESIAVDAVLVSDPGIFSMVRHYAPSLQIHISTQASTCNSAACKFWHSLGATRIVLARELTLAEIRQIRSEIPEDLELECFVHGAMCMAYSGRCLLSNVLTGRNANRGECAQPCRWSWQLKHDGNTNDVLDVEEDEHGSYLLNSRDLCLIEHIPELIEAGISSFKIEGRMKGAFYAAVTAKIYREAIDKYGQNPDEYSFETRWLEELSMMVHRRFDTGFYFDRPQTDAKIETEQSYFKEAVVCAVVTTDSYPDSRTICVEQRNKLRPGELVEIIRPCGKNLHLNISVLNDAEGGLLESTPHPKMRFVLHRKDLDLADRNELIPEGSFIRRLGDKDTVQNLT